MYTYVVLGAGRQGTAAAYDMARWGEAKQVILGDCSLETATWAAERVNQLTGRPVAVAAQVDVADPNQLEELLSEADACLSAVPYPFNLAITDAAIRAKTHLNDLGGHTGIARQQHGRHEAAAAAGITIAPNCGQVPGMGTSFMVYAMELLDEVVDVYMWDGGIPQKPRPPFNYLLTFHVAGLTNEYAEKAVFIRDGQRIEVEPMSEPELLEFPEPIGTLEAFVTGGGTDSMPWTYEGKLRTLQNKTLRHPGHFAQLRAYYELGLWDLEPVVVGKSEVIPRDIFHALFEPKVTFPGDKDVIVLRVKAVGQKHGQAAEATVELIDYFDAEAGFSAMERCTGWSAAIVTGMMARGQTPRGSAGVETQVPAALYISELRRRRFEVSERVTYL